MDLNRKASIPEFVLSRELDGQMVLLNLETEEYYSFDETGVRFWNLLASSKSPQEAFDIMQDEYDVDPTVLNEELRTFFSSLVENGLVNIE